MNGVCPARKCSGLVQYFITDTCFGCTRCSQHCPTDSIPMNPYHHHTIDEPTCIRCDVCATVCPVDAIQVIDL
jgi:Pyruvate/2-oxoacid:ferredoxin oxidoreductase delta subunit